MITLAEYTACDGLRLADLIRERSVGTEEVLRAALEAAHSLNPKINAFVEIFDNTTTAAFSGTEGGAFFGVPFAIKDAGAHYSAQKQEIGSRYLKNRRTSHASELAKRFRESGLFPIGRTNLPEFALGVTSESFAHGAVRNPWNTNRIAGGSSGGAAAAVAAGIIPVAHGNDGGGSIRLPASVCGVVGLKPSRGRMPMGPDIDEMMFGLGQEFVLTRSIRDTAALLDLLSGTDVGARLKLPDPEMKYVRVAEKDPTRLVIAFSETPLAAVETHPDVRQAIRNTAHLLTKLGHTVIEAVPDISAHEVADTFLTLSVTAVGSMMKGLMATQGNTPDANNTEPTSRAILAEYEKLDVESLMKALQQVNSIARRIGKLFIQADLWMTPVTVAPAVPLGTFGATDISNIGEWMHEIVGYVPNAPIFNMSGQPAISLPLAISSEGLPIGIQLSAALGEEAKLISIAGQLERAVPWVERCPLVHASHL